MSEPDVVEVPVLASSEMYSTVRPALERVGRPAVVLGAALFASLTAVGAWLRLPLPWVPVTLQTLFVLLAGLLLPPLWAAASQVVYLALGLAGFPVFAGTNGLAAVASPTFGYLLSFPVAAWVVARLSAGDLSFGRGLMACLVASAGILLMGALYLAAAMRWLIGRPIGLEKALVVGALVFLPGEIAKSILAAAVAQRLRAILSPMAR